VAFTFEFAFERICKLKFAFDAFDQLRHISSDNPVKQSLTAIAVAFTRA